MRYRVWSKAIPTVSFFLVISIHGALTFIAAFTIGESFAARHGRPDVAGAVFSALAVGGVVYWLIEGAQTGFGEPFVVVALIVTVVSLAAFIVAELRASTPLLDIRDFRRRGFATGSISVALQFLVIFGFFLLIVQYLQLVQGYDALGASMSLAPMVVPVLVLSLIAPWLASKIGLRIVSVVGIAGIAAGMFLLSGLSVDSTYFDVLWPLSIAAVGMGLSTAPATSAIVSDIPADEQGVGAAVNDAMREVGAAIGIAIGGSILADRYARDIVDVLPGVPEAGRDAVEGSFAGAVEFGNTVGPAAQPIVDAAAEIYASATPVELTVRSRQGTVAPSGPEVELVESVTPDASLHLGAGTELISGPATDETRERILDAAYDLFCTRRIRYSSMDEWPVAPRLRGSPSIANSKPRTRSSSR